MYSAGRDGALAPSPSAHQRTESRCIGTERGADGASAPSLPALRLVGLGRAKPQDRLRPGTNVEFVVDVLQMPADGPVLDPDAIGNFLVGVSLREQFQNLPFARRQLLHLTCLL